MRRNHAAMENNSLTNNTADAGVTPVIAIFDIGKTNKKLLLFNAAYKLVYEESVQLAETVDEDGFACEDVDELTVWIKSSFDRILQDEYFAVKAVNFSAYGASFVHLDDALQPCTPLYNYLKPYPPQLKQRFYDTYGGESLVAKQTASPVLGNLNSGMQLYRLKYEKPAVFATIRYSLHLPQYVSFALSGCVCTDITSVGCHTNLWNFKDNTYHTWVKQEGILEKLPTIEACTAIGGYAGVIPAGIGLHDSSAALIPYLQSFNDPFVLLSTGTWCISLNPFNHNVLSDYELHNDCLCYLTFTGRPVKASRLFAGYEHEQQIKRLAEHFNKTQDYYTTVAYNPAIIKQLQADKTIQQASAVDAMVQPSAFAGRDLSEYTTYGEAYHQLIADIIIQQVKSTRLVLNDSPVKKIFVDGGFGRNDIYMHLLAKAFTGIQVYAASVPQASSLGAAMVLHQTWNTQPIPAGLIAVRQYTPR